MPIKPQDKARILAEAGVDPKKYWMDDNGEIIDMPEQGPAETAIKTTLHNAPRTALGFVGSALGAAGAGAFATPETAGLATIPAALAGGAAGGAAGGFAGQALQEAVYPESWRLAQEARSVRAPITTKVADIGASMALMRPSATVFKAAARAPGEFMRTAGQLQPKTVEALANVGLGAGMSGGMAAAQGASPSEVALETALGALQVQPTWLGTKLSGGLFTPFNTEGLAQPGGLPTAEAQARFASALEAQNAPPQPAIAPDVLAELAKKFAKQQAADAKRIQEGVIAGEGARQNEAQRQKRAVVEAVMGIQPEDSKTVLPADIRSVDERLAATGGAPEQQMKLTPAVQQAQEAKLRGASPVEQELAMLLSPDQHKYFRDIFKKYDTEYGDLPENAASGRFTPRKSATEPSRTDISSRAYLDVYPHEALHALLSDTLNYGTARERAFTERALRELGIDVLTDANGRKSLAEGSEEALAKQVGEESVRVLAGKQKPAPVREAFSDFVDYLINDKLTPDVARRILRDRTVFGAGTRGIVARAARRGGMQAAAGAPPIMPEAVEQQPTAQAAAEKPFEPVELPERLAPTRDLTPEQIAQVEAAREAAQTPPPAAQAEAMQAQRRADELAARAEQMETLLDEQEARLRRLESAERTRQRISALPESPLKAPRAEARRISNLNEFEQQRPSLREEEGSGAMTQAELDQAAAQRSSDAVRSMREAAARGERIGPDTDVTRPETVEYTGAPVPANVRAGVRRREAMLETPADLEARRIEEQLSGRDRGRDRYQPLADEEARARNLEYLRRADTRRLDIEDVDWDNLKGKKSVSIDDIFGGTAAHSRMHVEKLKLITSSDQEILAVEPRAGLLARENAFGRALTTGDKNEGTILIDKSLWNNAVGGDIPSRELFLRVLKHEMGHIDDGRDVADRTPDEQERVANEFEARYQPLAEDRIHADMAAVGQEQRGYPESFGVNSQTEFPQYVYQSIGEMTYPLEHIGDLIHRLSSNDGDQFFMAYSGGGSYYGRSAAATKLKRALASEKYVRSVGGLEQALTKSIKNAFDYYKKTDFKYEKEARNKSLPEMVNDGKNYIKRWAEEHNKLTPVTELQKKAQNITDAFGRLDTDAYFNRMRDLLADLEAPDWETRYYKRYENGERYQPLREEQIQSPEFRKWFGDSVVRNETGKPKVVYHGMPGELEGSVFRESKYGTFGRGIYFTDSPNVASDFAVGKRAGLEGKKDTGAVVPVHLSLQQPFTDNTLKTHGWDKWLFDNVVNTEDRRRSMWMRGEDSVAHSKYIEQKIANGTVTLGDFFSFKPAGRDYTIEAQWSNDLNKVIRDAGFDGIIGITPKGFTEYVAFQPTQIKSATGNRGTFDPSNPNIRYQPLGPERGEYKGTKLPERERRVFGRGIFAGNVEALRRTGDPQKVEFAGAMEELYARIRNYTGQYEEGIIRPLTDLSKASQQKVVEALYDESMTRQPATAGLSPDELAAHREIRAGLLKMRNDQIAANHLIEGKPAGRDPFYFPHVVDSSIIHDLSNNPESPRAKEAERQFIDFNAELFRNNGVAPAVALQRATEAFSKFIGSLKPISVDSGFDYGAVSMPAGTKLPPTWVAADPVDGFRRYIKRFSRARAFYDVIGRDENAMRQIGRKFYYDAAGKEAAVTNPGSRLQRDPNVRALLENALGITHESQEGITPAIGRLANSLLLGNVATRLTDAATTPFKALAYLPPQYIPGLLTNMRNLRSSIDNAYKTGGVRRGDMMVVREVLGAGDRYVKGMDKVAETITKYTGSEALEKGARFLAQNVGEYIYDVNKMLADRGDKRATDFLNRVTPKWRTLAREETAQRIARLFQGSYDATNLPIWIANSPAAPFFSMMKWNIEQWNNFKRFAWEPALKGDPYALMATVLGGVAGGIAVGELREKITGKKQRVATAGELNFGFREGDRARASMEAMRKAAFLSQVTGTFGIVGELSLQAIDVASKDKPQGFSWPAYEFVSNIIGKIANAVPAAIERPEDALLITGTAANDLAKDIVAQYRILWNAVDRTKGSGEVAEANRRRDLRMSEKLRGEPTRFSPFIERDYRNERERQFDKARDRQQAIEIAKQLDARARRESTTGEEYKEARRKFRTSRIVGIPSRENNPQQFYRHLQFVRDTQGSEAADQLARDYVMLRTEQKWKSSMFR